MALISLISVLFVKEVPLRKTVRKAPAAAADDGAGALPVLLFVTCHTVKSPRFGHNPSDLRHCKVTSM